MQTAPGSPHDMITPPRLGTGPAAEGRRAALRTFHNHYNTLDGDLDLDINRVENGTAPAAFKDAYLATLRDLCAVFETPTP